MQDVLAIGASLALYKTKGFALCIGEVSALKYTPVLLELRLFPLVMRLAVLAANISCVCGDLTILLGLTALAVVTPLLIVMGWGVTRMGDLPDPTKFVFIERWLMASVSGNSKQLL